MMKRAIAILMPIMLCVTLIACSNQPVTQPTLESGETVMSELASATSGNEEISDGNDAVHSEKPTENSTPSTTTATEETVTSEKEDRTEPRKEPPSQEKKESADSTRETVEIKPPAASETTSPTEPEKPIPIVEETTTTEESTNSSTEEKETAKQTEEEKTESESKEDSTISVPETTAPQMQGPETSEPAEQFDIEYWLKFAKEYAQAKGLVLEPSAVDCWDNPIRAGAHCIYLERDIQSRLNRYANDEDITDVWIWYEPLGNDCYDIYIGYA